MDILLGAQRQLLLASLVWLGVVGLALVPAPLAPIAQLYHALCTLFPVLVIPGQVVPPLALGLLLLLLGTMGLADVAAGLRELLATRRVMHPLHQVVSPPPPRRSW